jgi:hypothetical protein
MAVLEIPLQELELITPMRGVEHHGCPPIAATTEGREGREDGKEEK